MLAITPGGAAGGIDLGWSVFHACQAGSADPRPESPPSMPIRRLPPETVNRIAAGEVVERPASAIKELVDNAIDAGATRIEVEAHGGGLTRILVADDGCGLSADELPVAIERHATSKLAPDAQGLWDLLAIHTMGFRGEALPSIGSVARLSISSRAKGQSDAWSILVEGGSVGEVAPAAFAGDHGARIEVRDLFYATPARLKFMKSERAEALAITEEIKRQAMANESVGFSLDIDGRRIIRLPPSIRDRRAAWPGCRPCWAATSTTTPSRSTRPATACA
jgi:DNA mismatch repair protein MutL